MWKTFLGTAGILFATSASASQNGGNEIWALERQYVDTHLRADHDALISIFHPKFLMWTSTGEPVDFAGARSYLERNYPKPRNAVTRIEPIGMTTTGDVTISHYFLHAYRNATDSEPARTTRHSHVWVRNGDRWLLLGGMNALPGHPPEKPGN